MIIDVKGARQSAPSNEPSRQKYLLKELKNSSAPFAIAAALASIALYLQSILPGMARSAPEDRTDATSEPGAQKPSGEPGLQLVESNPDKLQLDREADKDASSKKGSPPSRLLDGGSEQYVLVDSPPMRFQSSNPQPASGTQIEPGANDNRYPTPAHLESHQSGGQSAAGGDGGGEPRRHAPDEEESGEDLEAAQNRAPRSTGHIVLPNVFGPAVITLAASDLLKGIDDPDGDALQIRNLTASAGALVKVDDGWTFEPAEPGPVTLRYEITDGRSTIVQTAEFSAELPLPVFGSEGADTISGTSWADTIDGLGGNDMIDGLAGDDVLKGGDGDDTIVGGGGDDLIFAGAGNDIVYGNAGNDTISGGDGNDKLSGDEGNDTIFGDAGRDEISGGVGDDLLFGGDGDDVVHGGDGADLIFGEAGDDHLSGGAGKDVVQGGDGDDIIRDGEGADIVVGGDGDDIVIAAADAQNDSYAGGDGVDTIDYSASAESVHIDMIENTATGAAIGEDTIVAFEHAIGGAGDDVISGNMENNTLVGGGGDDTISGGAGDDVMRDGDGADIVDGGDGDDIVIAAADAQNDSYAGGDGVDTIDYSASAEAVHIDMIENTATGAAIGEDTIVAFENAIGGAGDDVISGNSEDNTLVGGDGDDIMRDGDGADIVDGGDGDDVVIAAADAQNDSYAGGDGADTIDYSASAESVHIDMIENTATGAAIGEDAIVAFEHAIGGAGDDIIIGTSENDTIAGGGGNDNLSGGDGDDTIFGDGDADKIIAGDGSDLVFGGDGADVIDGGAGDDTIFGEDGDDNIKGGAGRDVLQGGEGADTIQGGDGNDVILGQSGADILSGGAGDDTLHGDAGNDVISDGEGADIVDGGDGDDRIIAAADAQNDSYVGSNGFDTIDYSASEEAITINLISNTVEGLAVGEDTIEGFEHAIGGAGDDHFIVGHQAMILTGGGGENVFEFVASADAAAAPEPLLHKIVDFKPGDLIKMDKYDIFDEIADTLEDDFEAIYGDKVDADDARVRYRYDGNDANSKTILEADVNRDGVYETTVVFEGRRAFVIVEDA